MIFGVDQKNPNKYNLFFPIVYPDYHTNNRVAILAKDEHPDDRIEMQKNMIMNMSEMFIMPPRLFSANLKQIITKKQKKQETNQQKQNMIMRNDLMGGFGDDKLAAATSMQMNRQNKKGLKQLNNLIDHFIRLSKSSNRK